MYGSTPGCSVDRYDLTPHCSRFQNIPSIELSWMGPTTFLLHNKMSGSGSIGSDATFVAKMSSACLAADIRADSSRLTSVVSRIESRPLMFVNVVLLPDWPFASEGILAEQNRLQSPGVNDVRLDVYSAT